MSMPARTTEVCAPIGKAEEAMARTDNNSNCTVYDTQRAGNKFSAKMRCTGETPMEGSMEMVTEGNTMRGTTKMKMQGMEMVMKHDSTKLGTACEALDYSDYKPPVVAAPQAVDTCKMMSDQLASGKVELSQAVNIYVGADSQCGKHASMKNYCSAVQTPKGFSSLKQQERAMSAMQGGDKTSPYAIPLTTSLRACGLGTDKAAIDSLKKRLLVVAETNGDWDFLVLEGDDATFTMLTATAKRECSGPQLHQRLQQQVLRPLQPLCRRLDTRRSRRGDAGCGPLSKILAAVRQPRVRPDRLLARQPKPPPPASTTDKAKETLDKGKKALRGLFGG